MKEQNNITEDEMKTYTLTIWKTDLGMYSDLLELIRINAVKIIDTKKNFAVAEGEEWALNCLMGV